MGALIVYASESLVEILGYEPHEVVGKTSLLIFHPDEVQALKEVHYHAVSNEKVGSTMYMRLLHQGGFYVDCAVSFSTVYDLIVGIVTRAVNGPNHNLTRMATTAREVIEVRGGVETMRRGLRTPSPGYASPTPPPWMENWALPAPLPRTFYIVDRFTSSSRIMFVSNDLVVTDAAHLRDQSFYSIVRPRDREKVRQWVEAAKTWTPIVFDDERSGGYGYLSFDALKLPTVVPPGSSILPTSTDEEEAEREGQEFFPVEGIFSACSDGIIIIISPILPPTPHSRTPRTPGTPHTSTAGPSSS